MRVRGVKEEFGRQLELVLDNRLKSILARYGAEIVLKAGILEGATTPNGMNIAQYAFWNEFGTKFSPARPFMRQSVTKTRINGFVYSGRLLPVVKTPRKH